VQGKRRKNTKASNPCLYIYPHSDHRFLRRPRIHRLIADQPEPPVNKQYGPGRAPAGHRLPPRHGPVQADYAMRGPQVLPGCL
jgi:hypothetical protein